MPMHSGGFSANTESSADLKWSRGKKGSHKHEHRSHKRKEPCDGRAERDSTQNRSADQSLSKGYEEDTVSRSCSGSGMCGSEGSVKRGSFPPKDLPVLGNLLVGFGWEVPAVPQKTRSTTSTRRRTACDVLTRIARSFSSPTVDPLLIAPPAPGASSDAVLVEYNKPSLVAVEIGLGSVFVRQCVSLAEEPESESSLFLVDSRGNESFNGLGHSESGSGIPFIQDFHGIDRGSVYRGKDKAKQVPRKLDAGRLHNDKNLVPNKALLENFPYNKRDVLQSYQSPLVFLEMKDIVNFDTFTGLLTEQEQGQLMQFVSSADVARIPESLKSMFSSDQFDGALANFQHLLSEGMFDVSELSSSPRVLQHFQQLLQLPELTKSGWLERCSQLQNRNKRRGSVDSTKVNSTKETNKEKMKASHVPGAASSGSSGFSGAKLPVGHASEKSGEEHKPTKSLSFRGPAISATSTLYNTNPVKHGLNIKPETGSSSNEAVATEAGVNTEGPCFPGNSPFLSTAERERAIGDEYNLDMGVLDCSETDSLLYNLPNPMSFQQAELLPQPSWEKKSMKEEEGDVNQLESGGLIMSNTWHMDPNPAEWGLFWNNSSSCVGPGQALPSGAGLIPGRMLM
ncbi:protein MpGATA5 [Marchantia polymorpha subsp. ruderalis]|nr:hypothetical protein MARPO_0095s0046 [Marchantia polymorpha]BBN11110.1 hypothetical protein Mp_5g09130 [Marchantia polymorpha subsp. ruderalis]|eukprot:PTQ32788.1 hypothetical protein MARPO_0095s0046 [Marchantia polymorpha]